MFAAQRAFEFFDPFFVFRGLFFKHRNVGFLAQGFDFGFDRAEQRRPCLRGSRTRPPAARSGPRGPVWAIRLIADPIAALRMRTCDDRDISEAPRDREALISGRLDDGVPNGSVGRSHDLLQELFSAFSPRALAFSRRTPRR